MWQLHHLIILLSFNMLLIYANDSTESSSSSSSSKVATLNNFPSCNEKDENINDCLLKVFAEMVPRAKNGIPEINIPPIEPFVINKTSFIFSHPLMQGKMKVRNVKAHGLSQITVNSLQYKRSGDEVSVMAKAHIPELFVEGEYNSKIRLNTFNITSKGPFNATFTNIDVDIQSLFNIIDRDGHRYMGLKTFNFEPTVGNMKFEVEGLLPEPLLNDAIVEFLNTNWQTVYRSLVAETRDAWEPVIIRLSREYFSRVTVDAIIKED